MQEPTQELLRQKETGLWHFVASTVALDELTAAPQQVRDLFDDTFDSTSLVSITPEVE